MLKRFHIAALAAALSAVIGTTAATPARAASPAPGKAHATFAGGCFWCMEGPFDRVPGVLSTTSGYTGGSVKRPSYEQVSSGMTGHAEAVDVVYDPSKVSYGQLLQVFFSVAHDPTQLNRQGPDVGPQYRSTIFAGDAEQARLAQAYIDQLDSAKLFEARIATTIEHGRAFYPAEDYHQDYLTLHPRQPYIAIHDLPKIENLKRLFPDRYRAEPALVSRTGT